MFKPNWTFRVEANLNSKRVRSVGKLASGMSECMSRQDTWLDGSPGWQGSILVHLEKASWFEAVVNFKIQHCFL